MRGSDVSGRLGWSRGWWHVSVISAVGRLKQESNRFKANLDGLSESLSQANFVFIFVFVF